MRCDKTSFLSFVLFDYVKMEKSSGYSQSASQLKQGTYLIWLKLQGKKSGGKKCRKRSRTEEVSENTKTCRFPDNSPYITGAEHTLQIMRQAPVVIFVVNEIAASFDKILTMDERVSEICNAQSI